MKDVIFITSLSPSGVCIARQKAALNSWAALGLKCYSVNCKKEIEVLSETYSNINFIETETTAELEYGKPYVYINDILDKAGAIADSLICIINSDIIIENNVEKLNEFLKLSNDNLVFAPRYDFNDNISNSVKQAWGIDIFLFDKKHISLFKKQKYALGQPFWDLWFPMVFVANKVPTIFYDKPHFYHKLHTVAWSIETWKELCVVFDEEFQTQHVNPEGKYWKVINSSTIIK